VTVSSIAGPPRQGGARGPIRVGIEQYLNAPFDYTPPHVGWGSLIPLSQKLAYKRAAWGPNATDTAFAIILRPSVKGMVWGYSNSSSTLALNAAGAMTGTYDASNQLSLTATSDAGRVTAGGIRVTVMSNATSLPGRLYAGLIYTSLNQLTPNTYDWLVGLPTMRQILPTVGGCNSAEVRWRPGSTLEFDLSQGLVNASGASTSVAGPHLVVVGVGWPQANPNWSVSFDALLHLETTSGDDVDVGDESSDQATLSDTISMDMGFAKLSRLIGPDAVAVTANAASAVMDRVLSRSSFGRMPHLLASASSSSPLSQATPSTAGPSRALSPERKDSFQSTSSGYGYLAHPLSSR